MEQQSQSADTRFHIPKDASDLTAITFSHIPEHSAIGFSQIDFETGDILYHQTNKPVLPIKVGERIHFGQMRTTPVVKIVTDNDGRYWIKTESGSFYVIIGGEPRIIRKIGKAILGKLKNMLEQ